MTLWFCRITGGVFDYNYYKFLSDIDIEKLINKGYKVERLYKKEVK